MIEPLHFQQLVVDKDKLKSLQCAICLGLLSRPRQCNNGHLFCYKCIEEYLGAGDGRCPQCRVNISLSSLGRNLFVENEIVSLRVYCKYRFRLLDRKWVVDEEQGCQAILRLEDRPGHEKLCRKSFVKCPFENHKDIVIRLDALESHRLSCPSRIVECEKCNKKVVFKNMATHLLTCPNVEITCDFCALEVRRADFPDHIQNHCLKVKVACSYHKYGCEFTDFRERIHVHEAESMATHLHLLEESHHSLSKEVSRLSLSLQEKENQVVALGKRWCANNVKKMVWVVKDWKSMVKKEYIQSPSIVLSGVPWFIGLYPCGDDESSRGHLSLYLFSHNANFKKLFLASIHVDFTVTIVHATDQEGSISHAYSAQFPLEDGAGWGDAKTCPTSRVAQEFLHQGNVKIVLSLQLSNEIYQL